MLAAVVILSAVLTTSCAAGPVPTGQPTTAPSDGARPAAVALSACRVALPGHDVVSGAWTTVGALRTWGYGGPKPTRPLRNAFPAAKPTEPAAWCWTKEAADRYTAWGVHAPGGALRAITVTGPTTTTPSGEPRIP
jgi:hypothetical protein